MQDSTSVASSLSTFRGYLRDLGEADFDDVSTKLRLFVNYCQHDDVARVVAEELHRRVSSKAALKALEKSGLDGFTAGADRLAFFYELLFLLKQRRHLEMRAFLASFFRGSSQSALYDDFRKRLLSTLRADLGAVFDGIEAALPEDGSVDLQPCVERAVAALTVPVEESTTVEETQEETQQETQSKVEAIAVAPSAPAAPPATSSHPLVAALQESLVSLTDLSKERREDLLTDAKLLGIELAKLRPRGEAVAELARGFAAMPGLAEHGAALLELASKHEE